MNQIINQAETGKIQNILQNKKVQLIDRIRGKLETLTENLFSEDEDGLDFNGDIYNFFIPFAEFLDGCLDNGLTVTDGEWAEHIEDIKPQTDTDIELIQARFIDLTKFLLQIFKNDV